MATQNPIETEGTYPLPEAQVDRFMMKVLIDYPSEDDEFVIVQRVIAGGSQVTGVVSPDELKALQTQCRHCYVDPSLIHYAVKLISATRFPSRYGLEALAGFISFGASPRASIGLIEGARALALLRGRDYALPQDLADLVPDILRHRLVLSYTALAEGKTADSLIQDIMNAVPMPEQPLEAHVR
jgi:MoxR-like ATPase